MALDEDVGWWGGEEGKDEGVGVVGVGGGVEGFFGRFGRGREGRIRGEMAMRVHSVIVGVPRVVARVGLDLELELELELDLEGGVWDWGRRMRQ